MKYLLIFLLAFPATALADEGAPPETDGGTTNEPAAPEASQQEAAESAEETGADTEQAASGGITGAIRQLNESLEGVDEGFGKFNGILESYVIFFPIPIAPKPEAMIPQDKPEADLTLGDTWYTIPFAVLLLLAGSAFFTIRMGFINFRGLFHAVKVTAGKYDDPSDEGEVSHFQALTAALSATVGLGNIAGVALAITLGGPGATFWMVLAGLLGMTSKFVECTLGQKYREVRPDGRIMGGAMYYLSRGLKEKGMGRLGAVFGVMFAVLCVGGSFAGGNAFQVNQSLGAVGETFAFWKAPSSPADMDLRWTYGLLMALMAGAVIIGGIRRIASTAEKIVPAMCGIYVAAALVILGMNASQIPAAFSAIIDGAFNAEAAYGGLIGVLIVGFQRAAFSNEAGVGSAAIAHSAAKTDYAVREGIVALLEPLIDTVVVCTMTALVIIITGAYTPDAGPAYAGYIDDGNGAGLTSLAMDSQITGFKYVLAVAVILFAFSTMISWSYYGERCWAFLFGDRSSVIYRVIFLVFTFLGSVLSGTNVMAFGDLMIFGMAIPNILGLFILSGIVKGDLDSYWGKLRSGELDAEAAEYQKKVEG